MHMGSFYFDDSVFNSRLSLRPLFEVIKKSVVQGNPGAEKLYGSLIHRIEAIPRLLEPVDDFSVLEPHKELIDELLATVFPPTEFINDTLFGIAFPFKFKTIYASPLFKTLFLKPGTDEVNVPENMLGKDLANEKMMKAYGLVLKKYFKYTSPDISSSVYPFIDPASGLTKYLELEMDTRFVDVNPVNELPEMPQNVICHRTNRIMSLQQLKEAIPLDKFVFEGTVIVRINDVTDREIISQIKNSLLKIHAFSDTSVYSSLQQHIQNLIGIKNIRIGITPFFKVNDHFVFSESYNNNSLLYKELKKYDSTEDCSDVSECCTMLFGEYDNPVVFETITDEDLKSFEYLDLYQKTGAKSLILCPLKKNGELLGILEIASEKEHELRHYHIGRIQAALPLFTLALEKSNEALNIQIDRVIKEKFTAVQPSVEWKFTDAALKYIIDGQNDTNLKLDRIAFDGVYPLYGSIDVRNSSTERSHSIQLDLIDQLQMARNIVKKAQQETFFPLLQEIEFKIDKYIASASDALFSDEEILIQDFLQDKIISLFEHLSSTIPGIAKDVKEYFAALDPQLKMIYRHRKAYEESIAVINDRIARFIDAEQASAQKVFPHYFERYVTDGVEFNVYIGQSIAPRKKFDELYLRNMKMWQLSTLARAAQLSYKLQGELNHPLQTTQLILAHSIPISISFRTAERKFDVDGAYNIRYEIIKKRIDKVRIKTSNERLTQPDKIAIVYSQAKEAAEYREYIEFLQNQQLLKPGIEEFELEELQGVIGLKALRVEVNYEPASKAGPKIELSSTTTEKLLGK